MMITLRSTRRLAAAFFFLPASMTVYGQGTQMLPSTQLEVNLGWPELAKWNWEQGQHGYHLWYDNTHYDTEHPAMYKRCGSGLPYPDPGAPPVRTCMQQILHSYRMQGVTGVRIMFQMANVLDGPAWLTGFGNLLDDLVAAQLYYVTLTPAWEGANWEDGIHYTVVQNPAPRQETVCTNPVPPATPYLSPAYMRFSPTSPYGERCAQDPGVTDIEKKCTESVGHPWRGKEWRIDGTTDDTSLYTLYDPVNNPNGEFPHPQENIAYRCSPINPYFLGWPTILTALGTALQAVRDRYNAGMRLRELDVQNELALELFPVRGRLIVDNTQPAGNDDVLQLLRAQMQAKGFDTGLVTYSGFESRTSYPPSGGVAWDCGSYWTDSARILGVEEIASAIGGGQFGNTSGDESSGLKCGGDGQRLENALPYGHSQPKVVDLHFSPCREGTGAGGSDCDPSQWDEVNLESAKTLSGLHSFQRRYYPLSYCQVQYPRDPVCGSYGYEPNLANSLLMLGEAQGHGLVPERQTPGDTDTGCAMAAFPGQNWDVRAGRNTALGFNQSTIPNRNLPDGSPAWVIFRPWEYPQHTVTPPDPYYCNASRLDSMYIPSTGAVTNQVPSAVSVNPSSGNYSSQTFALLYSDPDTYLDLSLTYVLVNSSPSYGNGCYVEYNRLTNQLRLANDAGTGWLGPVSLAAGGLQNTQCAIDPGGTKSEGGTTLTLNLPLRFLATFAGAKTIYMSAQGQGGLSSDWQSRGTWTVPGACSYSISPTSASFPAAGGNGSVSVTTQAGCGWTTTGAPAWVTITSGASGTGSGTVNYTVAANTGGSRQATLTIAGQAFTVTQAAASCSYSISPSSQSFPAAGGNGSVAVTAGAGCNWTATSNQTWVTITSGASGTGNGTVNYTVAANTANTRQGTLTIAGQTFTITQSVPTDVYFQNQTFTSGVWLYQALNSIVADTAVTVSTGASVTFASANFIRLGPGFQATAGTAATTFRAVIDPTIH